MLQLQSGSEEEGELSLSLKAHTTGLTCSTRLYPIKIDLPKHATSRAQVLQHANLGSLSTF